MGRHALHKLPLSSEVSLPEAIGAAGRVLLSGIVWLVLRLLPAF